MGLAIFAMVSLVLIVGGLLLVASGYDTRHKLPVAQRSHRGLGRLSIGIVAMSLPLAYAVAWVGWAIIEAFGALATV
jgi:hypothetical protein